MVASPSYSGVRNRVHSGGVASLSQSKSNHRATKNKTLGQCLTWGQNQRV